ncbi:hypothetical protein BJ742DRAFT_100261 [Cladochytrium replicatum]|nr:hypothetical protein BJ742DRAFT_100261 [Cladochytrium replicatum]
MDDKGRIIGVMDSGLPVLYGEDGHEAGAHGAKEAVVVDVLAEGDDLEDSEDEENGENRTSSSLPRRPDTVAIADEPPPALPYRPEATPPLPERASDSATASSSPAAPAAQPPAKGGIATLPQMLLNKAITLIGPDNVAKGQETVVKGVAKGHEMINEGVARGQQMFSGGVKAAETQLTRAGVKLPTPVMLMFQRVSGGNQVQAEITPAQSGKENTAAGAAAAPLLSQQAAAEANAYIPRGITTVGNPSERGIAVGGATTARALPSASNTPAAGTSSNASAVASSAVVEVEEVIEVIDISGTAQAAEKKPLLTLEQKEKLVRGVTGAMKYYVRVRPVAAKAVKQFSKHAKKDKSKQGPAKRVVASIAKVGLKTMDLVVATGEKSVENFVKDASSAVVDPVRKKVIIPPCVHRNLICFLVQYGKGAAELAQSAVETVAMVYIDDKGISRKAVVKKATKQVVSELVVVGESSSSSSTSVTKKKK